ncbi:MAG: PAS domain S-box protein, partial [Rhodospirillaceae bacterium]
MDGSAAVGHHGARRVLLRVCGSGMNEDVDVPPMGAVTAIVSADGVASRGRVIRLARRLCAASMAAVLVRDDGGPWKAPPGDPVDGVLADLAAAAATAAFPLVVADTLEDPAWAAHPHVVGPPGVRFLVVMPLATLSDGQRTVLAVADDAPRRLEDVDDLSAALRDLIALAERERLHQVVLDTAVDGIVTIDGRGIIQRVNPATTRMFGYAAGELTGANVAVLMPESDSKRHDGYLRSYGETGQAKIIGSGRELMARRRDGSTFPIELTLSQIDLPGQRMFTGILRDVSRR